ncbi:MAG: EamA family transporter [Deltaproteobacteria bacterium]|nr:EamA family transporter [Deltaproteobacteria bacterium]
MPLLILLLLLQIIWSSSFVAMKFALGDMPVGLVMILRYGIASLCFFLFGAYRGFHSFSKKTWLLVLMVGVITFSLSPFCQLKSLMLTQVIDVSVLVSMEPLITALMASLILKERIGWDLLFVFLVSATGVLILSGITWEGLSGPMTLARLFGNLLFLAALGCEAIYSTTGRYLSQREDPLKVAAWMHLAGFLVNLLIYSPTLREIPSFTEAKSSWTALLFLAIFCSFIGYAGWYLLLKKIPASRLALSLFLQPVIGSLTGYLLLNERFTKQTAIGASLIVFTLLSWILMNYKFRKEEKVATDSLTTRCNN